ncbi:MAG: CBS domain-containing protein [Flavobacteriales bacterium]|nr:CBS domain-containing protein [Flavobacteriales bacterium]
MKKREAVSNIMKKNLFTLDFHTGTLTEAKSIMEDKHIRHLPVVKGEKLAGIISLTDIHRISFGGNYGQAEQVDSSIFHSLTVEQVMKSDPRTVQAHTTIKEVAEQLAVEEFHALPVVDDNKKLEGIVTTTDLVNYLLEQY